MRPTCDSTNAQQWGLALLGQDVETSAAICYRLQFQLGFNNFALVLNLNFFKILGFGCRRTFFNIPPTPRPFR
jgi:hypothetical protein